jgi:hypothetical protein
MLLTLPVLRRLPLMRGTPPDLTPFVAHRPAPLLVIEPAPEVGPVLITLEYHVPPEDLEEFTRLIHQLKRIRMRDGAVRWGVFQDTANPERLVETFVTDSWLDFLRARERMTAEDRIVRDQIRRLHQGSSDPQVSRMIYVPERDRV